MMMPDKLIITMSHRCNVFVVYQIFKARISTLFCIINLVAVLICIYYQSV